MAGEVIISPDRVAAILISEGIAEQSDPLSKNSKMQKPRSDKMVRSSKNKSIKSDGHSPLLKTGKEVTSWDI